MTDFVERWQIHTEQGVRLPSLSKKGVIMYHTRGKKTDFVTRG